MTKVVLFFLLLIANSIPHSEANKPDLVDSLLDQAQVMMEQMEGTNEKSLPEERAKLSRIFFVRLEMRPTITIHDNLGAFRISLSPLFHLFWARPLN